MQRGIDNYFSIFKLLETNTNEPIQIVYVPSHLYHMLFELFKNALRAVVEYHGTAADEYPPVEALIVSGKEDVTVKVRNSFLMGYFRVSCELECH